MSGMGSACPDLPDLDNRASFCVWVNGLSTMSQQLECRWLSQSRGMVVRGLHHSPRITGARDCQPLHGWGTLGWSPGELRKVPRQCTPIPLLL